MCGVLLLPLFVLRFSVPVAASAPCLALLLTMHFWRGRCASPVYFGAFNFLAFCLVFHGTALCFFFFPLSFLLPVGCGAIRPELAQRVPAVLRTIRSSSVSFLSASSHTISSNLFSCLVCIKSDAMGVVHGPGHMEVKYTTTGPCLVEVGTRCHGGEGTWQAIAEECLGYNQVPGTCLKRSMFLYLPMHACRRYRSWLPRFVCS